MKSKSFTYPKKEKLKSRKQIKKLFEEGKTLKSYPLLIRYSKIDSDNHKIGVSVSKRSFKNAVNRIRIKRQLREGYRLNKWKLTDSGQKFAVMLIFIGKKELPSLEVHHKVKALLKDIK